MPQSFMIFAGFPVWHDLYGAAEPWLEAFVQVLASHAAAHVLRGAQENSVEYV